MSSSFLFVPPRFGTLVFGLHNGTVAEVTDCSVNGLWAPSNPVTILNK